MVSNIENLINDIHDNGAIRSIEFRTQAGIREVRYMRYRNEHDKGSLHFVSPIFDEEMKKIKETFDLE